MNRNKINFQIFQRLETHSFAKQKATVLYHLSQRRVSLVAASLDIEAAPSSRPLEVAPEDEVKSNFPESLLFLSELFEEVEP